MIWWDLVPTASVVTTQKASLCLCNTIDKVLNNLKQTIKINNYKRIIKVAKEKVWTGVL